MSYFNKTIDDITRKNAIKGKHLACRSIYDDFSKPVYTLAYKMLQNREDALDVMQNAFVLVFSKLGQWSKEVKFGFWVRKITINQSLDMIKKNKHFLQELEDHHCIANEVPAYDLQHDVSNWLQKLPPLSRNILWLYEVEGLTHAEIAELYGMSVSFSKSQLSRTKKILSLWLNNREQENEQKQSKQD